jgi:hypothetical protein
MLLNMLLEGSCGIAVARHSSRWRSNDVLHDNGRWHLLRGRAGNDTPLIGQATNDLFGDTGDGKILDKWLHSD